jgi:hypothetical protein
MRLPRPRDTRVAHLLHLRRVHGLAAGRHGWMTMGYASRVHARGLWLICCHHLARVVLAPLSPSRGSRPGQALAVECPSHRPKCGRAAV